MHQLTYGYLTKYWNTILTMAVGTPLVILGFMYLEPKDLKNPYALLFVLAVFAYNLYLDLKNYSSLKAYQVSADGIRFNSDITPWSYIESYEHFGPKIVKSRKSRKIKLAYASGVFIKANGDEYIVYESAKNYRILIEQLVSKGILCLNS